MPNSNIESICIPIIDSVDLLHEKKLLGQCLVIIYSSIDAFGFLDAEESQVKATGTTFKDWCDKYLLSSGVIPGCSADFWGARCGVLHTHMAESDLSNRNTVKKIRYVSGPPDDEKVILFLNYTNNICGDDNLGINIDLLVIEFLKATVKFSKDFAIKYHQSDIYKERESKILQSNAM
ncbi:hypothetical protein [Psychromonas sp. SP041]|uniref:hypothetical protein n=1 Tax=Psychromonas sp. SP041 TaxID=1365007 RepID=UPI0003F76BB6|nr:hypothetical protein [Psychromonas sp. SP041]